MAASADRPLRPLLATIAGLYVIEGFPMAIFQDVWSVYFVDAGMSDASIGLLSGFGIAWSLKAFWSPLVHRFGDHRAWMSGALSFMAFALLIIPFADPLEAPLWWLALIGGFCIASATQDIAIDAYTIGVVPRGREGEANAVRIGAYRAAILIFGGATLFLPGLFGGVMGWTGTHHALAGIAALMAFWVWRTPSVAVAPEARRDVWGSFRSWTERPGLPAVAAFVLLFRLSDFAIGPMLKPFWRRSGLSLEEIGVISTGVGSITTVAGAAAGGWLVSRLGIARALWIVGGLALASNLAYAGAAWLEGARAAIYGASVVESFCTGLATAAFMSFLMRICDRRHATVQYATLTAAYAFTGRLLGTSSGFLREEFGYAGFFALTALFTLPAFLFLPVAARWVRDDEAPEPEPSA